MGIENVDPSEIRVIQGREGWKSYAQDLLKETLSPADYKEITGEDLVPSESDPRVMGSEVLGLTLYHPANDTKEAK